MRIGLALFFSIISFLAGYGQESLIIGSLGEINISNSTAIVVGGDIGNNGQVTVESGSSLIQTHSGISSNSGSGDFLIKRVGLNSAKGYNMWCSPIQSADIINTFIGGNPCDMYVFKASTQEWKYDFANGFSTTCNGNSVTFTTSDLHSPDGISDGIMDVARGYFMPGGVVNEREFDGQINDGQLKTKIWSTTVGDRPTWSGDDWNMVGNPYPSPLDLQVFWDLNTQSNAITDGIYFWVDDGSGGSDYHEYNDYAVWNSTGSSAAGSQQSNGSTPAINGHASSGQGFWVHAAQGGNTSVDITFNNSMRTSNKNQNFYKRNVVVKRAWLTVFRDLEKSNQILVGLTDSATTGYDSKYDARRLATQAPMELSFVQDSTYYVILGQPSISFDDQEILPLHFKNDTAGVHRFELDSTQNVGGGISYYLIDSLLGITHELVTPYIATLDTGNHDDRFYLLYRDVINSVEDSRNISLVKVVALNKNLHLNSTQYQIQTVRVYSILGKVVYYNEQVNNRITRISLNRMPPGVYLVNYTLDNGYSETRKIVVQ